MKIKIYEDRSYSRENFSNEGTENENLATTLYFQFPETVNGVETSTLNKYIVFDINGEPNTDILTSNNSYSIPTAITQLGTVSFNIYLVAPTNNGEDSPFRWISKKITLNFNDANDMTEIVITVEEINIFNSLLSELNSAIANIELLEDDFEEFKKDYDELKDDFEEINRNYQAAISQVENVNIDAIKTGSTATITITNKEGTEKSVEIQDGTDYIITQNDYQEIANVVKNDITPLIPTKTSDIINNSGFIDKEVNNLTNYTLKTNTGSSIELSINSSTYVMTLNLKNSAGTVISTGTVDLPLETMVVGATYDNTNKKIVLTLKNGSTIDVPVADLISGLQSEITSSNKLSADLVDDTSTTHKFTSTSEKSSWNAKYNKPSGGIPKTDLENSVQTSLGKADTALQEHQDITGKEDKTNKTDIIDENSTSTQYAGAKAVYDYVEDKVSEIETEQTTQNEHIEVLGKVVNNLPKTEEKTGSNITLENTIEGYFYHDENEQGMKLNGQLGQDGTPTPDNEIPVKSVTGNNAVRVRGKNLFNGDVEQGAITAAIGETYAQNKVDNATRIRTKDLITLNKNKTYTISCKSEYNIVVQAFNDNKTLYVTSVTNVWWSSVTFTNIPYIAVAIKKTSEANITPEEIVNAEVQLETGSTATTYEPYVTPITKQLSLGNIKLCKIGTYQDYIWTDRSTKKWYFHEEIPEVTYNGSETEWTLQSINTYGIANFFILHSLDSVSNFALCNYFKLQTSGISVTQEEGFLWQHNGVYFRIKSTTASTISEWTTWLSTHNTKVKYALATPTDTEITDTTMINQLEEIYKLLSNNGTTIIETECEEGNMPIVIKAKTLLDMEVKYTKPSTGIPKTDLASDVQTSLGKADTAIQDVSGKQNITDNTLTTTNKTVPTAINEVNSIAKGANQALSYTNYSAMITAFNSALSTAYNVGQNIYIETLDVPDLWVYKIESTSSSYTYTTDSAFTTALETNGYVQVGYYKLSALETQKVNLTNYVEFTDYASASTAGVVKISVLTQAQYDTLVANDQVDSNTYYMIKEV